MTDAVPVNGGFANDNSGVTQRVFRTTMFGFKRDEVLEYIERITSENTVNITQLTQQVEKLEKEYATSKDDNDILLLKIKEASETLQSEKQLAAQTAEELAQLRIKLEDTTQEMAGYKSRLFSREQETVVLKADNSRLNTTIDSLTLSVGKYEARKEELALQEEKARQEAQCIIKNAQLAADAEKKDILSAARDESERAQQEARMVIDKAGDDALALIAAAEREKNDAKQMINSSAVGIAESIAVLKTELSQVDAKIAAATEELQRATVSITLALEGTERNLETLGVQVRKFPEPAKAAHFADKPIAQPQLHKQPMSHSPRRHSVSEAILDGLTRILGDR
ncbi:MAG: hypothetical protein RR764_08685 [Oscillospiraceae bacterium]